MNTKAAMKRDTSGAKDREAQGEREHPILYGLAFGIGRTVRLFTSVSKRIWKSAEQAAVDAIKELAVAKSRLKLYAGETDMDSVSDSEAPSVMGGGNPEPEEAPTNDTSKKGETRRKVRKEEGSASERSRLKDRLASRRRRKTGEDGAPEVNGDNAETTVSVDAVEPESTASEKTEKSVPSEDSQTVEPEEQERPDE